MATLYPAMSMVSPMSSQEQVSSKSSQKQVSSKSSQKQVSDPPSVKLNKMLDETFSKYPLYDKNIIFIITDYEDEDRDYAVKYPWSPFKSKRFREKMKQICAFDDPTAFSPSEFLEEDEYDPAALSLSKFQDTSKMNV